MFKGLILFSAFLSLSAQALPLLPNGTVAIQKLPSTFTSDYDFEGIVALSNCSGSLIRLENAKDTDLALMMTNGHCYEGGFPDPGTAMIDQPSSRRFNLMNPDGSTGPQIRASRVIYSTMTKTDITLYRLSETYAQILQRTKIRPFTLASKHAASGQNIQVISGYWKRGYSCSIETFVYELQEDGYTWQDSIRYSRPGCEVIGGTSGSPIIASGTRTVIGINNTGNDNGERCTMDNPCEVDKDGNVEVHQGYSYGQETYLIYSCVNAQGGIDLATPGCLLPH